jgi:hypothetical protein
MPPTPSNSTKPVNPAEVKKKKETFKKTIKDAKLQKEYDDLEKAAERDPKKKEELADKIKSNYFKNLKEEFSSAASVPGMGEVVAPTDDAPGSGDRFDNGGPEAICMKCGKSKCKCKGKKKLKHIKSFEDYVWTQAPAESVMQESMETNPFSPYFSPGFDARIKSQIIRDWTTMKKGPAGWLACQVVVRAWGTYLKAHNIPYVLVDGMYRSSNGESEGHTWLEINGEIFDPTAEQFDDFPDMSGEYEEMDYDDANDQ